MIAQSAGAVEYVEYISTEIYPRTKERSGYGAECPSFEECGVPLHYHYFQVHSDRASSMG